MKKTCLIIPPTSPLFKQFSQRIHDYLTHHCMTLVSYVDRIRARQDSYTAKLIGQKLKKTKNTRRQSDKSGNLYVDQATIFEQKAMEYQTKTGAYEELLSNPVEEILSKVTHLLNDLHMKTKDLLVKQYKENDTKTKRCCVSLHVF